MKNTCLFIAFILISCSVNAQQILICNNAKVSFFSSTIMEDIEGKSATGGAVIDTKSGNLIFKVKNTSFQFKKKLMQEHFNENYMESDKYPLSEFKGTIKDPVNMAADGTYKVTVEGNLNIHGISKAYSTQADLLISKGTLNATAVFKVKIAEHDIKIPKLVFKNIAEYVEVRIQATFLPKK
ncbi:YceI family protein [Pedobacter caeni]|uniref:YceI-like domain-containing protein n=1 Tax=Pedobacter caeni TaxID=288992 RepID=A0A1M4TIY9_9SPHI|nr:YceI family protein [Pedobacter caeni]SHE44375.1 YceI-like domain-containing protein [Pedobacter caeni]